MNGSTMRFSSCPSSFPPCLYAALLIRPDDELLLKRYAAVIARACFAIPYAPVRTVVSPSVGGGRKSLKKEAAVLQYNIRHHDIPVLFVANHHAELHRGVSHGGYR